MYDYLNGYLACKSETPEMSVTVDVNGVGYLVIINGRNYKELPDLNDKIKIYTVLNHREDSMSLYGFLKKEDRDIFKIVTSVSGVGPKMGMMLLDEFGAYELISLVIKEDYKELTRAKGVGAKLAQKIILELKDKLINIQKDVPISLDTTGDTVNEQSVFDAQAVLISLGYEKEEIKNAITKAISFVKDKNNAEEILKESLKVLSN